jgi:uncharacterized protein YprB with RNaseH-like and TPR domain
MAVVGRAVMELFSADLFEPPKKKESPHPRAYLDIETDFDQWITVVGIFRPDLGHKQWVRPNLVAEEISAFLKGVETVFTYNGARFDLPIIKEQLKLDVAGLFKHQDLMHDCWAKDLYGGLKAVEKTLGIHRDTDGTTGVDALHLWAKYQLEKDAEALEYLLRYNREDVENLEALARKLGVIKFT